MKRGWIQSVVLKFGFHGSSVTVVETCLKASVKTQKKKKKDGRGKKKNGQFCIRETGSGKEDKEIEKGKEEEEEE